MCGIQSYLSGEFDGVTCPRLQGQPELSRVHQSIEGGHAGSDGADSLLVGAKHEVARV